MSHIPNTPTITPPDLTSIIGGRTEHGFFSRIPGSFAYPLMHGGLFRWFIGSVIIWLGVEATKYGARSLFLCGPVVGYLATYLLLIANASGDGKDEIPGWPSFDAELVSNFAMFSLTILLCYLPAGLYVAAFFFWDAPFRFVILPLCLGLFLMLMAIMRVSMLQTLESLSPVRIVQGIFRAPTAYMGLCLVFTFLGALHTFIDFFLKLIPYAGTFLSACLYFYFLILFMRILGIYYYTYRHKLDWFSGFAIEASDLPNG